MINADVQYQQIASRVAATWESTYDGFKLYIQVLTAIVGGSVWLKLEIIRDKMIGAALNNSTSKLVVLADVIVFLLTAICLIMIFDNAFTWWIWRRKLAMITSNSAVPDRLQSAWEAFGLECVLALGMICASWAFWANNPFAI